MPFKFMFGAFSLAAALRAAGGQGQLLGSCGTSTCRARWLARCFVARPSLGKAEGKNPGVECSQEIRKHQSGWFHLISGFLSVFSCFIYGPFGIAPLLLADSGGGLIRPCRSRGLWLVQPKTGAHAGVKGLQNAIKLLYAAISYYIDDFRCFSWFFPIYGSSLFFKSFPSKLRQTWDYRS